MSSVLLLLSRPVWTCAMVSPLGAMDAGLDGTYDGISLPASRRRLVVASLDLAMAKRCDLCCIYELGGAELVTALLLPDCSRHHS